MKISYLENLYTASKELYANFKKENVLKSDTLREMFSNKYIYNGSKLNTILVKSLGTNAPVELKCTHSIHEKMIDNNEYVIASHDYTFFNNLGMKCGSKSFKIQYDRQNENCKKMIYGFMSSEANQLYKGVGVRADEIQIKFALDNNISSIPRLAAGHAVLYHIKMGFLPANNDLIQVNCKDDVDRAKVSILNKSGDLTPTNLIPIVDKFNGKYYVNVNKTQALANVAEIKDKLSKGWSFEELINLYLEGLDMQLSGKELNYWKRLIDKTNRAQNNNL